MLYSFDINTDTLASLIRYGIANGKVCAFKGFKIVC